MESLLLLLVVSAMAMGVSAYIPPYSYLIDCGSSTNTTLNNRTFYADEFYSDGVLSVAETIAVTASSSTVTKSEDDSTLLLTARIFTQTSSYTFQVQHTGRLWIRLHFFPFTASSSSGKVYNLIEARFSVSAQNVTLLKNFQLGNSGSVVLKEYCFDVVANDRIILTFSPKPGSFAFINALEVFPLPTGIIPAEAGTLDGDKRRVVIGGRALETTARVNMGNAVVHTRNDTLWRQWDSDAVFRGHQAVSFVKNISVVNYSRSTTKDAMPAPLEYAAEDTAPPLVYGSGSMLDSDGNPNLHANLTWIFNVDSGFDYLVRFHLCEIIKTTTGPIHFNIYLNSRFAHQNLNLDSIGFGLPFYFDVITKPSNQGELTVSVGPLVDTTVFPMAFLNGLEIIKISNSKGSLDASDNVNSSETQSRRKLVIVAVVIVGVALVAVLVSSLLLLRVCKRRRRKLTAVGHGHGPRLSEEHNLTFSSSKIGYRFPLSAIEEATDQFSESLVVGVGGFGKVYKGILRDGTKVAVKRGNPQSRQGLIEFRTEIEMLSQFRHRHLVSLIGYCDERNEMIIIYEFMENGTLKDHLYGSNHPVLTWKQRLEICIGSAKGLHYLHTGSAKAIIHRDVKSANILVDDNFMAKVADFGLSKAGPDLNETHVSTAIKGSFGYLDPEYLTRQQLTEKSDVYSFGVVMLEVLTGRSVIDPSRSREEVNLVEWYMKCQRTGKVQDLVDPVLEGEMKDESLLKFVGIANKCLSEQGVHRPPIGDVLWNLESALQLDKEEDKESPNRWFAGSMTRSGKSKSGDQGLVSMGDLDGVSMSQVFAQMIEEEEEEQQLTLT